MSNIELRQEDWILKNITPLAGAACSVRWSLVHWHIKTAWGEPMARDIAAKALPRSSRFRDLTLADLKLLPRQNLALLVTPLLHKKSRRRLLNQQKKLLRPQTRESNAKQYLQDLEENLLKDLEVAPPYKEGQKPAIEVLFPELQSDLKVILAEPQRAAQAFPIEILKSQKEEQRLRNILSPSSEAYGEQINSYLWQLANHPDSIELPQPRTNDLLFQTVQLIPSENLTGEQIGKALAKLFVALGEERKTKELCEHGMARILRHEFALSRDRNTISSSDVEARQHLAREQKSDKDSEDLEPWDPEDASSMRGYEDVDYRMEYEAIRNQLPPKQKEALDIYLEHFQTNESIKSICVSKGLDSDTVRNNFQAIKEKTSKLRNKD